MFQIVKFWIFVYFWICEIPKISQNWKMKMKIDSYQKASIKIGKIASGAEYRFADIRKSSCIRNSKNYISHVP